MSRSTPASVVARNHEADRPHVSVVVPVYDCKDTLEECLDSLVAQTLESLEIIVVNDGSPDTEQEIIDDYVRRHPELIFSYIKENGGLSDARNYGVERARGRFVGYVDSDDYVEPNMFQRLYEAAWSLDCEIAIGQYVHYGLDGKTSIGGRLPVQEGEVFPGYEFLLSQRSMVVWNKLYRKDLVDRFPQPLTWFEDVAWTPVVMTHADRVCYVDEAFYHYVRREGSIASSHDDPRTLQGITSLEYAIANSAPEHRDAVVYMGIRRLMFEADVRPAYADRYLGAIGKLRPDLLDNEYYKNDDWLRLNSRPYMQDFPIIPKRIVTPRFGAELNDLQQRCVDSWSTELIYGDGEITVLDGTNWDVDADPAALAARRDGKIVELGQYACLVELVEHGGVALDSRLMGHGFIAPTLLNGAFLAFSSPHEIGALAFGAVPGHRLMTEVLDRFREQLLASEATNLQQLMQDTAVRDYGARLDGSTQELRDDVRLYGRAYFASRFGSENITTMVFDDLGAETPDGHTVAAFSEGYVDELVRRLDAKQHEVTKLNKDLRAAKSKLRRIRRSNRWRLVWRLRPLESATVVGAASEVRRVLKTSRNNEFVARREAYAEDLERSQVDEDLMLFESFYGRGLISNPYALFLAWTRRPDFGRRRAVWVLDDMSQHVDLMARVKAAWPNVSFVERGTDGYMSVLARAKYLVNDVTFYFDFVKRPNQIYINTWHSITVKSLGFDVPGRRLDQKNVVRNMLMCDYFLAANDFVRDDTVLRAHRMDGLMPGRIVVEGHPRNDLTFSTDRLEIYAELEAAGIEFDPSKATIVYAPTWRGLKIGEPSDDLARYQADLEYLRSVLGDTYNVLIRLHQATHARLRLRDSLRRSAIPPTLDANRMFAAVDVLITDYSSIFFDFMVTNRPVLFYLPDLVDYQRDRGVYFDAGALPGPAHEDIVSIGMELRDIEALTETWRPRYEAVADWSCPRDDGHVSERVLDVILDGRKDLHVYSGFDRKKPRLLLYAGPLTGGRLAAKVHNVVDIFGTGDFDISVLADDSQNAKVQWNVAKLLDVGVRVIGRSTYTTFTRRERMLMAINRPLRRTRVPKRLLHTAYRREWRRCFGDATFDLSINLDPRSLFFAELLDIADTPDKFAWHDPRVEVVPGTPEHAVRKATADTHRPLADNSDFERIRNSVLSRRR